MHEPFKSHAYDPMCGNRNSEAARPSVPQQGQAQILPCQMVQDKFHVYIGAHELRDFCGTRDEAEVKVKEIGISESAMAEQWFNANPEILRQFGFNKNHRAVIDVMEAYATFRLAASRSEEATAQLPDVLRMDAAGRPVHELLHLAAQYMNQNGGGPLADCLTLKAQEIESLSEGAPVAGSTEREAIQKCAKAIEQDLNNHKKGPYREGLRDAMRIVTALAGTDTDVAEESK